jgi:hypothetical protein
LDDAQRARATFTDWQTARIVAIVAATHSKRPKYDPVRWMANGAELKRRAREAVERELPTGDELLTRMKSLGVQIIDNRQHKG